MEEEEEEEEEEEDEKNAEQVPFNDTCLRSSMSIRLYLLPSTVGLL